MSNSAFAGPAERLILDACDSTMDEARRRALDLAAPTWILAHHQRKARGRRGRAWRAPKGHFSATLVFRPACAPSEAASRSLMMANALSSALSHWVSPGRLAHKWPNDVLLDGGKVAGILLESAGGQAQVDWLSIGVGVNLSEAPAPDGNPFPPVSLGAEGLAPEDFLDVLAPAYEAQEDTLARQGISAIRDAWLAKAARLGETITARTGTDETTGRFEGLDQTGNLVLSTPTGRQVVAAADIFF